MALQTITPNHKDLQKISLVMFVGSDIVRNTRWGTVRTQWLELDNLFAQLWESHSIRPRVLYSAPSWVGGHRARICVENLLAETATRGIVDLIERAHRL
jgi:hypothetical protein